MKNKIIYISLLVLLFVVLLVLNSKQVKSFKWDPTYSQYDRNPFGAYALDELLQKSWKKSYEHSYKSIQRMINEDSLRHQNVLVISEYFQSEKDEINKMLDYAGKGHTILLAGSFFDAQLTDSLGIQMSYDSWYDQLLVRNNADTLKESRDLTLCTPTLREKKYAFPKLITGNYFDSIPENCRVLAINDSLKAIAVLCPVGKGSIIFCCTPLIFTNYGILSDNAEFVWGLLSYMEGAPLIRTEFYQVGSDENQTPFSYILKEPSLRWALYITLVALLIFLIFTAKRKQKVIPVIKDPENQLLKFVRSMAALYLRKSDNNDILRKKYTLFGEQLHKIYGIDIINQKHDNALFEKIANKTGHSQKGIKSLFDDLQMLDSDFKITDSTLMELVIKMDKIIKT